MNIYLTEKVSGKFWLVFNSIWVVISLLVLSFILLKKKP